MESTLNRRLADDSCIKGVFIMPNEEALIRYIRERQISEDGGIGYSFVRGIRPNIRDTYFAISCLKMLSAASPDDGIVLFISGYDSFDLNGTYYAMKCLKYAGADVDIRDGQIRWEYRGTEQARPCAIPTTPLISYFRYDIYGMYGSSIFSSPLSTILKRIELGDACRDQRITSSLYALLKTCGRQDIMVTYIALEILAALEAHNCRIPLPSDIAQPIRAFLKRCTTRKGHVASPGTSTVTLESAYAGHMIARRINAPDPLGVESFIDSLQNPNGGFRRSQFGGISSLESCYLAMAIVSKPVLPGAMSVSMQ